MPKEPRTRKLTEKGLDYAMQKKAAEVAAEKRKLEREEAAKMNADIDELAGMFGDMKTSAPGAAAAAPMDVELDMAARGRRRKSRKSTKKAKKKARKTRKH